MPPSLLHRVCEPEIMDQPGLEPSRLHGALEGLERINWWSRSAASVWGALRPLFELSSKPLRVLDIATGAADVPIRLFHRARRRGITLELSACDRSQPGLEFARHRAAVSNADIRFFQLDAVADPLPSGFDVIMCSLFLHHLSTPDAEGLLRRMGAAAERLVIVNDLRRSSTGWWLAWLGGRILSRSDVVHVDGPRSVAAAFTIPEIENLAKKAGLVGAVVRPRWPWRYLLTWQREAPPA